MKNFLYKIIKFLYSISIKPIRNWKRNKEIEYAFKRNLKKIKKKRKKREKANIVFFIQYPEMWNSLTLVYEKLKNSKIFNVYVIAFPKRGNKKDFSFSNTNDALEFCRKNGIPAIDGYSNKTLYPLSSLDPNYIFVQRPYDGHLPKEYSLAKLLKYGLICYVPYQGRITKGIHLKLEFGEIYKYFSFIFADCSDASNYVKDKIEGNKYKKYQHVYDIGFPRFELISEKNTIQRHIRTVLWTPRWSISSENNKSYFYEYLDIILSFFDTHKELNLIIRPHPLMFSNFIKTAYKTQEEIDNTISLIKKIPNVKFDENENYLESFFDADILLSDLSSLLLEFFFTKKPVILFDKIESLTDFGKMIVETFYYVEDKETFIQTLERLIQGIDSKKTIRDKIIDSYCYDKKSSSEEIAKTIVEDFIKY